MKQWVSHGPDYTKFEIAGYVIITMKNIFHSHACEQSALEVPCHRLRVLSVGLSRGKVLSAHPNANPNKVIDMLTLSLFPDNPETSSCCTC